MLNTQSFCNLCRFFNKIAIKSAPALSTLSSFENILSNKKNGLSNFQPVRFYGRPKQIINFDFSGDLKPKEKLDSKELFFPFKEMGGLDTEDEIIKRLCSLEFCDARQHTYHKEYETMKAIDELCGPDSELEKKIVRFTIHIRNMLQSYLENPGDKRNKSLLVERIAKRKKYMKQLRAQDYDKFIWLLKELKIRYIPARRTRYIGARERRINAENEKADKMILQKEEELCEMIEKEKEEYLKSKPKLIEEIEREIKEYGLDREEILRNVEEIRVARETPPKPERKGFASLKDWSLPKVKNRYYKLK